MKPKRRFLHVRKFVETKHILSLSALVLWLLLPQRLDAHGGGKLQISNAPLPPYQVSVWLNPPTVRAGQPIHVTVGVTWAESGEPMLDAAVEVAILAANGETVAAASATTEQSVNRLFYEADLPDLPVGSYQVQLTLTSQEGSGALTFPLEIVPAAVWPWVAGGLLGAAVMWLVIRGWRKGSAQTVQRRQKTAVSRHRSVD